MRQRNRKTKDYTGLIYGRLTAVRMLLRDSKLGGGNHIWLFSCECGSQTEASIKLVRDGNKRSCGCLAHEALINRNRTHGMSRSPEYKSWKDMRARCSNPNNAEYHNYGGRGISVHPEWSDFSVFIRDMGSSNGLTLERSDVNGDYSPHNCRWASKSEQANNKRNTLKYAINGVEMSLADWCRLFGISLHTAKYRIKKGRDPFYQGDYRR